MSNNSAAAILGRVCAKVDKVDGLCAVLGQLDENGAGNLGRFLAQQSEGEMLTFVNGLNTASAAEVSRVVAALNAGQTPTAPGAAPAGGQLGRSLATFPTATLHERGLVTQSWGKEVRLPWGSVASINYSAAQDTITLMLVPVAQVTSRTLTLTALDGTKVTLRGETAEGVYGPAVAATTEPRLARAIDRLAAGEKVPFGLLSLSKEGLTYTVLRYIGPFPTVPWDAIGGLGIEEGFVHLGRHDSNSLAPTRIAAVWAVDDVDLVKTLANSLAHFRLSALPDSARKSLARACPGCGQDVFVFARLCRHCWHRISRQELLDGLPAHMGEEHRRADALFPPDVLSPAAPAGPASTGAATSADKGNPCPRCKHTRSAGDLTCQQCGHTEWLPIILGGLLFGVGPLLAAIFLAPMIEEWDLLSGAVRWGGGGIGLLCLLIMTYAAVVGLRAPRRKPLPTTPAPAPQPKPPAAPPVPPPPAAGVIRFDCPKCGHRLKVKQELAGKSGKCPGCGSPVRVPPAG